MGSLARSSREPSMYAFHHRTPSSEADFPSQIAIMIFVLSALHPDEWARAVENAWTVRSTSLLCDRFLMPCALQMLKPGGMLLFRDYGRHGSFVLASRKEKFLIVGVPPRSGSASLEGEPLHAAGTLRARRSHSRLLLRARSVPFHCLFTTELIPPRRRARLPVRPSHQGCDTSLPRKPFPRRTLSYNNSDNNSNNSTVNTLVAVPFRAPPARRRPKAPPQPQEGVEDVPNLDAGTSFLPPLPTPTKPFAAGTLAQAIRCYTD